MKMKFFFVHQAPVKLGAFKLKADDDEEIVPSVGSLFGKKKLNVSSDTAGVYISFSKKIRKILKLCNCEKYFSTHLQIFKGDKNMIN